MEFMANVLECLICWLLLLALLPTKYIPLYFWTKLLVVAKYSICKMFDRRVLHGQFDESFREKDVQIQ